MKNFKDYIATPVTESTKYWSENPTKKKSEAIAELKEQIKSENWERALEWCALKWLEDTQRFISQNEKGYVIDDVSGDSDDLWAMEAEFKRIVAKKLKSAKMTSSIWND